VRKNRYHHLRILTGDITVASEDFSIAAYSLPCRKIVAKLLGAKSNTPAETIPSHSNIRCVFQVWPLLQLLGPRVACLRLGQFLWLTWSEPPFASESIVGLCVLNITTQILPMARFPMRGTEQSTLLSSSNSTGHAAWSPLSVLCALNSPCSGFVLCGLKPAAILVLDEYISSYSLGQTHLRR
jgi:hypothetical protein